ncbi:MAG: hypothetical protein HY298_07695 [Verrucomicrobia bacterium]|nr:hypothetical protein [Verrucomicrobiota bacterium]
MSTVQEIKAAIDTLSPAERAELEQLLREPHPPLDPEVDSPELEAELLKAIDGPYTPYSREEMQSIVERIIREEERK